MTAEEIAERRPRRSLVGDLRRPAASLGRRELAAGLAALAVAAQLVLAPVTLLIAAVLTLAGRISRWRPEWLLLPAVAGACWLAAVTIPVTVAALEAGSGRLMAAELAVALRPARLLHPGAELGGAGWWLPRELPLALLAGTAEAAIMLWPGWRQHSGPPWRPGAIALLRRRRAVAALAAGHTVTAGGCAIGADPSSGRLAGFSWAEAEHGVLLAGPDERELGQIGLAVACAAMRLRKTVIAIDLPGAGTGKVAEQVAALARRLGLPATALGALDGATAIAVGRAIRSRSVLTVSARTVSSRTVAAGPVAAGIVSAGQAEPARQVLSDLSGVLAGLRNLGLRGDCLAWISGCDRADADSLAGLLELGPATGTSVLLSTASTMCAEDLAACVSTTVACGRIPGELASRLASPHAIPPSMGRDVASTAQLGEADATSRPMAVSARSAGEWPSYDILRTQSPGAFTLVSARCPDAVTSGLLVPIALTEPR